MAQRIPRIHHARCSKWNQYFSGGFATHEHSQKCQEPCPAGVAATAANSGRRQPHRGERQRIVLHDQPTLRGRERTGGPEVGHLPVTDLGGLRKIVQRQRPTDPASLVVNEIARSRRPIASAVCLPGRFRAFRGRSVICFVGDFIFMDTDVWTAPQHACGDEAEARSSRPSG
jgi:hypothetical protein